MVSQRARIVRELWFIRFEKVATFWAGSSAMGAAYLKELMTLEQGYWWHVAKRRLTTQMLIEQVSLGNQYRTTSLPLVIDGGIGTSGNLLHWQSCGLSNLGVMSK